MNPFSYSLEFRNAERQATKDFCKNHTFKILNPARVKEPYSATTRIPSIDRELNQFFHPNKSFSSG